MRKLIILFTIFYASIGMTFDFPPVKVEKINDRVYAMLGPSGIPSHKNGGFINNNLVIIGKESVILVDAGSHRAVAEHIHASIKTVTDKPVRHILVTHHHADHHLGAQHYEQAHITATEFCATQISEGSLAMVDRMRRMSGLPLEGEQPVKPHTTVKSESRQSLEIDGVRIELIATPIAHTRGDLLIWLPDDGVLAGGDILVHTINPNFNDGNLKSWIEVVNETILALPFDTVMPGHGPLMTRQNVEHFRNLITKFYSTVETVYLADGMESDVRKKLDLNQWKRLGRYDQMIGRNINKVWLEVEEENF